MKQCVVIVLLFITGSIYGQEAWTLRQCVDYAISHNINVRQYELQKASKEITYNTTLNSRYPNLNAVVDHQYTFGRGQGLDGIYQDKTSSSSSFSVRSSVSLFSGFRISNKLKSNKLDIQAAEEDINKAKEDISLNVAAKFLQVIYNKEVQTISGNQVDLSKNQIDQTSKLVEAGRVSESELYEAEASLAKDEASLVSANNDVQLAILDLTQLLNFSDPSKMDVTIADMNMELLWNEALLQSFDEIYHQASGNRPSLKSAEYRLKGQELEVKVAKSDYYPTLSLGASYGSCYYHIYNSDAVNSSFSSQIKNNGSKNVGLTLSIPIFNKNATRNSVRMAQLSQENYQLELDNARQTVYKDIQQAYYNAVAALADFRSSEKTMKASEVAFRYEEQKYNAGKSTAYQYNEVKTRLAKSQIESAQAKYEFVFRCKILEYYKGKAF